MFILEKYYISFNLKEKHNVWNMNRKNGGAFNTVKRKQTVHYKC